jgi:hypothetical protein
VSDDHRGVGPGLGSVPVQARLGRWQIDRRRKLIGPAFNEGELHHRSIIAAAAKRVDAAGQAPLRMNANGRGSDRRVL